MKKILLSGIYILAGIGNLIPAIIGEIKHSPATEINSYMTVALLFLMLARFELEDK